MLSQRFLIANSKGFAPVLDGSLVFFKELKKVRRILTSSLIERIGWVVLFLFIFSNSKNHLGLGV